MREPKLRAWDVKYKTLIHKLPDGYNLQLNGKIINTDGNEVINFFRLMRSTGILDKNKIEIYEGDIVKYEYINFRDGEYIKEDNILKIKFESGSLKLDLLNPNITELGQLGYSIEIFIGGASLQTTQKDGENYFFSLEVIGNIYQNKELLITNK